MLRTAGQYGSNRHLWRRFSAMPTARSLRAITQSDVLAGARIVRCEGDAHPCPESPCSRQTPRLEDVAMSSSDVLPVRPGGGNFH